MDKWRNNRGKAVAIGEDSLLPPTRRISSVTPPLLDKRRSKKWSIDGIFKSVFSKLDAQSSSSSFEDLSKRHRRKIKGKSKGTARSSGYAPESIEGIDYSASGVYRNGGSSNNNNSHGNNNNNNSNSNSNSGADRLGAGLPPEPPIVGNAHSRSSDGSMDGPGRRVRKDTVKARAEAKRDRLCASDSSTDESSEDETGRRRPEPKKRSSRASRTERYLKRMCNGGGGGGGGAARHPPANLQRHADSRSIEGRGPKNEQQFQPIEREPRSDYAQGTITGTSKMDVQPISRFDNGLPNSNYYGQQEDTGVNVLIQQTLQYFNDFEKNLAATQHKERKSYSGQNRPRSHRSPGRGDEPRYAAAETHTRRAAVVTPPKPPSREYRSRLLVNGSPMDKYPQILKYAPRYSEGKENGFYESPRSSLYSPNTEVRNINEGRCSAISPSSTVHKFGLPLSPPRSPLREPLNAALIGGTGTLADRNTSPLLDASKSKYLDQPPLFSMGLQRNDYENSNYVPFKKAESEKPNNRRSLKTLEEAMCELETIYNSLQLADEELLDRAEQRTMEEFHYKGFTASSENFDNEDTTSRRKTWGDPTLGDFKEEPEIPDRLKDDMAYRRMHPKERPSSVDGQSSLSSISYLMTSPIPSRREMHYIDPKRKPRRKEPDVTLDDVVFRSMQYANNTLKVIEPQPPFGIPLGPITTATDSDYLHTRPTRSERARSPYIPSCEPDLVTDDLAFRNLRKDTQPSQYNGTSAASPTPSFGIRKKRAVRSLSANLYGLINSSSATSPLELDSEDQANSFVDSVFDGFFNDVPVKRLSRRTSDPQVLSMNWQKCAPDCLDVNRNRNAKQPREKDVLSDIDTSNRSWDESSDERIQPLEGLVFEDTKTEYKANSDKGSSYVSSNCSTPSLSPQLEVEPITEQEVSVYKQLCQDLENLVQLTKGIDAIPASSESQKVPVAKEVRSSSKSQTNAAGISMVEEKAGKFNVGEMIDSIGRDADKRVDGTMETSPIKREISTILDTLKKLGEDSNCSNSSCSERMETKEEVVVDDESFNVMTKEICDLAAEQNEEEAKLTKEKADNEKQAEEEERKDRVDDNVFFRRVQLAKLSGDWKESTPNGAVINRRTSLTSESNWEGEKRSCERVSRVCNASHDMSRLTAKYICYITNHIMAQFCLLLVFFLVLLLAIVTVP